jgi:hypothetical protein
VLEFCLFLLYFHQIPIEFSTCSPSSQCVPQHVPNSSSLYPIFFAIGFTIENLYIEPRKELTPYLFWDCPKLDFLLVLTGQTKMPIRLYIYINNFILILFIILKNLGVHTINQFESRYITMLKYLPQQSLLSHYITLHNQGSHINDF